MGRLEAQYRDRALGGRLDDAPSVEAGNLFVGDADDANCARGRCAIGAEFFEGELDGDDARFHVEHPGTGHAVAIDHEGLTFQFTHRPHRVVVGHQQHVAHAVGHGPLGDEVVARGAALDRDVESQLAPSGGQGVAQDVETSHVPRRGLQLGQEPQACEGAQREVVAGLGHPYSGSVEALAMVDTALKQRIASRIVGSVKATLVSLVASTPGTAVEAMTGLAASKKTS